MAFVVRTLFLTAIVCSAKAGYLSGHHNHDSYTDSALSAPSASYGAPSHSYGPPALSGSSNLGDVSAPAVGGSLIADAHAPAPLLPSPSLSSGSLGYPAAAPAPVYGPPESEGGLNLDSNLPPAPTGGSTILGAPRVIGTTVTVGKPIASATRYELQSVVQNVVRRVPIEVVRHVQVAVPQPVPVPVRKEVRVPVPQPYPVPVDVVKKVPYPVYKTEHVEVERPVPVEVVKHVPFEVIKKVPIPVDRPYEVIKKVHVPVEKHVEVPVPVWKPYPIHIIKHVTHYKKKSCCW